MDSSRNFFDDEIHTKLKLDDFAYDLPDKLIAQYPLDERDQSRLMVLDRESRSIDHRSFRDLLDLVEPGD